MPIPIELAELRIRLQEAGVVVVEEPDHLTIRLPFFASVQVRFVDERLRFDAYFAFMPRTKSTLIKFGALAALCTGAIKLAASLSVGMAAIATLVGIYESIRWMITEQAITRTQMVWLTLPRFSEAVREATRELPAGASVPVVTQHQREGVPRV